MLNIGLVCALLCLCVYLWCVRVRRRVDWASSGIPVVPGNWIKGSCSFLLKENPAHWFIKIQREYPGAPLLGVTLPFFRPALVVCSPELAAEALKPGVCKERFLSGGPNDPVGSLNIFTTKEPLCTLLRRQVTPMLTAGRVRAAAGLVRDRARRLTQRINQEIVKRGEFNLRQILTDYTTDIISVAALGVESDSLLEGKSVVREATKEFMKYDLIRGLTWSSIFFCPKFLNILRTQMFPKHGVKLIELALKKVENTESDSEEGKKARGTKEMLLSMHLPDQYKHILKDSIVAQAIVLIQGGFETTASVMGFCLLELAFNQDIQECLYQELCEAKERVGGDMDSATLAELPYLNAVIKETMRLYAPMGWIDRVTAQPLELAGVPIPVGTPLLINALGMHRDPLYFEDPDRFDPERFLPENEHRIQPFSYLPFGDGSKVCIGRRFGEQTAQYGISEIILNYTLAPGKCTHPKDFLWEQRAMFLLPGEPLTLNLTPRT